MCTKDEHRSSLLNRWVKAYVPRSTITVLSRKGGVSVYYRIADPRIMQAFDLITEVMLINIAREEELRKEFAVSLQGSTLGVE